MTVHVAGVGKRRGPRVFLEDVSFEVRAGSLTAVIGPNGAGKSTLFRVMTNIASGTGSTTYNGVAWTRLSNPRCQVGAYLGSSPFYGRMGALEHLRLVAASCGASSRRASQLLGEFGLESFGNTKISRLSLGARQRLGVAASMVGDPGILILDEPISALDPTEADHVQRWLEQAVRDGRTVIVSTHDLHRMSSLASHALVLSHGRVRAFGQIEELSRCVQRNGTRAGLPEIYRELT